ncbi:MAG: ABC transporter permease [Desulfomonile tiedjei]|nr:ABC transporter permease [Desulfomonile tiedjei]
MLASDLIEISLRQLSRNRRRYRGVIIGIALGIAGLVTVLTMGDSVETDLGNNLEMLGSATVLKATWDYDRSTRWHHGQYYLKDVDDLSKLPGVRSASPVVWMSGRTIGRNERKMIGRVMGVEPNFFPTIHIPVPTGRTITHADVENRTSVCVVGPTITKTLFPNGEDPIGKELLVAGHVFRIVGEIGGVEDKGFLETVLVPLSVARARYPNLYEIKDIYVRAINWDVVPGLQRDLLDLLRKNHSGYVDALEVKYFPERVQTIQNAIKLVKLFIYASLLVTLLLGGLGITNVMLGAVRERTKEIGLRKAVGATEPMIMKQFIIESVTISVMGAGLGMLTGFISVEVLKRVFETVPAYSVFVASLVGGVIFGVLLGIISGYLPARKASRLDASEAMRFE